MLRINKGKGVNRSLLHTLEKNQCFIYAEKYYRVSSVDGRLKAKLPKDHKFCYCFDCNEFTALPSDTVVIAANFLLTENPDDA